MDNKIESLENPTPEQILSALDQTGFVFEYRVAQRLKDVGFTIFMNMAFTDSDSGKFREIDVIAEKYNNVRGENSVEVIVRAKILAECKNYADPLLVIGQGNDMRYHNDEPHISFDPLRIKFENRDPEKYGGISSEPGMWAPLTLTTQGFLGSQLLKMQRRDGKWKATNEAVYDSITLPLAKAIDYERQKEEESLEDYEGKLWTAPNFTFTFPVLVTAGSIFRVDVVKDSLPIVEEVSWSPLARSLGERLFIMDVVRFDNIDIYVSERIDIALKNARRALENNPQLFNPEWLQDTYGESTDPLFVQWLGEFQSQDQGLI